MPEPIRSHLANLPCPSFKEQPWAVGPELKDRRVSIISTAGLHRRGDRPFEKAEGGYRVFPGNVSTNDLVMTHISTNFDQTGYQQDWNVVFPLDRLKELVGKGATGSAADCHYSFMGATDPSAMDPSARNLADLLEGDRVDTALLVSV